MQFNGEMWWEEEHGCVIIALFNSCSYGTLNQVLNTAVFSQQGIFTDQSTQSGHSPHFCATQQWTMVQEFWSICSFETWASRHLYALNWAFLILFQPILWTEKYGLGQFEKKVKRTDT